MLNLTKARIHSPSYVHYNLGTEALYEQAIRRNEGLIAQNGPLLVVTGQYTGRSPKDKFTVLDETTRDTIWWGDVNKSYDPKDFDTLHFAFGDYFRNREIFVQDCYLGADPQLHLPIRVITEDAWQSLFARNMFLRRSPALGAKDFIPEFTLISASGFRTDPKRDKTNSEAVIVIDYSRRVALIANTRYGGEIKKTMFTVMNYLMPERGVLGMHCSANVGPEGDTALFFGLSGTGKTTLSADPRRKLIGDDEHGWSDRGIFNFEGGCYAKVIRLSATDEPEIYDCTHRFGTILENVTMDRTTRRIDLDDAAITENTRASYPLEFIPDCQPNSMAGHPKNIVMLVADAFGVMPPISRLSPEQAMYYFLSGYTAKLAGTERGVTEPQATFSTCFGAPFMARRPAIYAEMLGRKMAQHDASCWLVNTGWSGGPYGVGERIKIQYTRAMIDAALSGKLDETPSKKHRVFGVDVPQTCPGVPDKILNPEDTWADQGQYWRKARELALRFMKNFTQYAAQEPKEVREAGPVVLDVD